MTGNRKLSGWQLNNRRMQRTPARPEGNSRWEREIRRQGLIETEILANPEPMREWVRNHIGHAFVPEKVLEGLRMKEW